LPINGVSCALRVVLHERIGGIRVAAAPVATEDPGLEAFAGYLASGLTTEALEIARGGLLVRSPLGAVMAGLVLLQAGEDSLGKYDTEPSADLPDTWVLAGERALRLGDEQRATAYFGEALQAGLPLLADATGLLVARLRSRLADGLPPAAVERLAAAADRSDLAPLVTTFAAVNPCDADATQGPAEDFDGWFEYRREWQRPAPVPA
jgi:hypothetical protein